MNKITVKAAKDRHVLILAVDNPNGGAVLLGSDGAPADLEVNNSSTIRRRIRIGDLEIVDQAKPSGVPSNMDAQSQKPESK